MLTGLDQISSIGTSPRQLRGVRLIEKTIKAGIRLVPNRLRFAVARRLAARPRRVPMSDPEAAALRTARPLRLGPQGRLPAWTWGDGPAVALVHGWGGRAAQMAPLARRVADAGFRAVVFDVAGHGESKETEARWEWFIRDIGEAADAIGPLAAFIGHSAGGLTLMAARRHGGVKAGRFVCICAPHHPYPPVRGLQRRLDPGDKVLQRYRDFLGRQFRSDWKSLEAGFAWQGAGPELLLCYDEKDRFIEPTDGEHIHALCPGSMLVKTARHGHARILAAADTAATIGEFLRRAP